MENINLKFDIVYQVKRLIALWDLRSAKDVNDIKYIVDRSY